MIEEKIYYEVQYPCIVEEQWSNHRNFDTYSDAMDYLKEHTKSPYRESIDEFRIVKTKKIQTPLLRVVFDYSGN